MSSSAALMCLARLSSERTECRSRSSISRDKLRPLAAAASSSSTRVVGMMRVVIVALLPLYGPAAPRPPPTARLRAIGPHLYLSALYFHLVCWSDGTGKHDLVRVCSVKTAQRRTRN